MANNKTGFNYYKVNTDRYQDMKVKRLKKEFGCSGIAVYDYIICEIYRVEGCFLRWDEDRAFDVADYFGIKESLVQEIITWCGRVCLFDMDVLTRVGVLTSLQIQSDYLDMCSRAKRKDFFIPEELKIVPEESFQIPEESENSPSVCDKVKYSKVKYSKVKEEDTRDARSPLSDDDSGSGKKPNADLKKEKSSAKKESNQVQLPFDGEEFRAAWGAWKEYKRKEHKFQYKSEHSEKAALSELYGISEEKVNVAILIIKQSVSHGWKGFFKLKNDYGDRQQVTSNSPAAIGQQGRFGRLRQAARDVVDAVESGGLQQRNSK